MTAKLHDRCSHINRVRVHSSVVVGGASLGQCEKECLPGMTVCLEHANKEALGMLIRDLVRKAGSPKKGVKWYASRYWNNREDYEIVLYRRKADSKSSPHDYVYSFTPPEWKRLGGRIPAGRYPGDVGETIPVRLMVKEITA